MFDSELQSALKFHFSNNFQAALDAYCAILRIDPSNHAAWHYLGILLIQSGEIEYGKSLIEHSINLAPSYLEAKHNMAALFNSIEHKYLQETNHVIDDLSFEEYTEHTVSGWRQLRMIDFASSFKSETDHWLTIGDYYGYDTVRLNKLGVHQVTPSNLTTHALKINKSKGLIPDYLEINAEKIDLPDNSFDYVMCKEALHHMPRPYLAIYEMLRVARKGVFVIEPNDVLPTIDLIKNTHSFSHSVEHDEMFGNKIIYRDKDHNQFLSKIIDWWEHGPSNYVYTLSKREIVKISNGLGIPAFAIKTFNDYYDPAYGEDRAVTGHLGFDKTCEQIQLYDQLCANTGIPKHYITAAFFKQSPNVGVVDQLKLDGFDFHYTSTRFLPLKW